MEEGSVARLGCDLLGHFGSVFYVQAQPYPGGASGGGG